MTPVGRLFHTLGIFILKTRMGQLIALFLRTVASLFDKSHNFKSDSRNIILQTFFTGIEIFPPLFAVATLFGTVVIIYLFSLMDKMGFSNNIGFLIVVIIIRELSPIFTAFLIAGRTGSSLTTYIGSMVINSEVDALATMGINPIRYLVMPSVIGGTIAMIIMNVKPLIFGIIITINACYQALNIKRDIRQVPKATSRSVIMSFLYIVFTDALFLMYFVKDYMQNLSAII